MDQKYRLSYRSYYIQTIKAEKDMEVNGQDENGHEVVELCRKMTPDIILMDISMPGLNGIVAKMQIL